MLAKNTIFLPNPAQFTPKITITQSHVSVPTSPHNIHLIFSHPRPLTCRTAGFLAPIKSFFSGYLASTAPTFILLTREAIYLVALLPSWTFVTLNAEQTGRSVGSQLTSNDYCVDTDTYCAQNCNGSCLTKLVSFPFCL